MGPARFSRRSPLMVKVSSASSGTGYRAGKAQIGSLGGEKRFFGARLLRMKGSGRAGSHDGGKFVTGSSARPLFLGEVFPPPPPSPHTGMDSQTDRGSVGRRAQEFAKLARRMDASNGSILYAEQGEASVATVITSISFSHQRD